MVNKIAVRDLVVRYGGKTSLVVDEIDVESNEIFGIIGPANAGKTTFLRVLNRMDEFTPGMKYEGSVHYDGHDTRALRNLFALRRRIGVVFPLPVGLPPERVRQPSPLAPRAAGAFGTRRSSRPASSAASSGLRCGTRSRTAWTPWAACCRVGSSSG